MFIDGTAADRSAGLVPVVERGRASEYIAGRSLVPPGAAPCVATPAGPAMRRGGREPYGRPGTRRASAPTGR